MSYLCHFYLIMRSVNCTREKEIQRPRTLIFHRPGRINNSLKNAGDKTNLDPLHCSVFVAGDCLVSSPGVLVFCFAISCFAALGRLVLRAAALDSTLACDGWLAAPMGVFQYFLKQSRLKKTGHNLSRYYCIKAKFSFSFLSWSILLSCPRRAIYDIGLSNLKTDGWCRFLSSSEGEVYCEMSVAHVTKTIGWSYSGKSVTLHLYCQKKKTLKAWVQM